MGGPAWLALVAVVWWTALLNPSQARSFSTGVFDRADRPATVIAADRQLSLQTNDRRRTDPAGDGSSPDALASAFAIALSFERAQGLGATTHRPTARPTRSPAQPRAPPANT